MTNKAPIDHAMRAQLKAALIEAKMNEYIIAFNASPKKYRGGFEKTAKKPLRFFLNKNFDLTRDGKLKHIATFTDSMVLSDLPEQHPYFFAGAPEQVEEKSGSITHEEAAKLDATTLWRMAAEEAERK